MEVQTNLHLGKPWRLVRRSTRSTCSTVDRRFGQAPPTQAKDLTFAIMDLEKKIKNGADFEVKNAES